VADTTTQVGTKLSQIDGWQIAQGLWVILTGFLVWAGRRAMNRLDELEDRAVMKEDFDKAIADIRSERSKMHEENKEILGRIEDKIDIGAQATLVEKVRYLEDRVANHDSYVRVIDVLRSRVDQLDRRRDG
jgi:hypothetical protein